MTMIYRYLTVLMAFCGFAVVATPAQAVTSVYTFSGVCLDCGAEPTDVTGTLTLEDYTAGTGLTASNFVSFAYSSPIVSYTIDAVDAILGTLPSVAGPSFVAFTNAAQNVTFVSFNAAGNSSWCIGQTDLCAFDTGEEHSWSLASSSSVPEPAAWALMILGFGVAGVALRNRRGVAVVAA